MRAPALAVLLALCLSLPQAPAALAQDFCSVPEYPKAEARFVVDNDNNLRQWGGADYAKAPVIGKLDAGDMVRLLSLDGRWARVRTRDGKEGWVNAKCLAPYETFVTGKSAAGNYEGLIGCGPDERVKLLKVDLDGDGRPETLRLTCESGNGCSNYFLDVLSPEGKTLFAGPREGLSYFIFCSCNAGEYLPETFFDLDGDGRKEMILLHPRSDVSPTPVEAFRFNGSGFDHVLVNKGFFGSKAEPDFLRATDYPKDPNFEPFRYLYGLKVDDKGRLIASIAGPGAAGEAEVRYTPEGFRVVRWTAPYKKW
ncbi:hypothetical protein NNJEOMEG_02241 [Fundidesulfovibrio magnetotacticus]|uniref:SH3b domain-containing protein n=1 Tax=Fundidesulfovibrio magnetotacticus TaxID=2730080 RepID=A0A6V8LXM4_9BACT|nr:SH3 domain-containing protein [Fundidesulfovibrio magnetotacticus]GFK94397.1 hypothetical protein NNJEOMEG_02241 [Fundidesulfovibrio magnetotacticus]